MLPSRRISRVVTSVGAVRDEAFGITSFWRAGSISASDAKYAYSPLFIAGNFVSFASAKMRSAHQRSNVSSMSSKPVISDSSRRRINQSIMKPRPEHRISSGELFFRMSGKIIV